MDNNTEVKKERLEPKEPSQNWKVLKHMRENWGEIDTVQAMQLLGVFRLSARISELRKFYGFNIITKTVPDRAYPTYKLIEDK